MNKFWRSRSSKATIVNNTVYWKVAKRVLMCSQYTHTTKKVTI